MKRIAYLFGLAVAALTFAAPAVAETYVVSRGVWGYYQQYLRAIGSTRNGSFAITTDGSGAYYVWCPSNHCIAGTTYRHDAIQSCEREYGTDCVGFADRDDILVSYVLADGGTEPTTTAAVAPAPMTRITLSSSAQAEIDRYLKNSKSTGRAWALAVATDGSKATIGDCPATGGGGYLSGGGAGPACNLSQGTAQELAEKKAVKSCGGPSECVLLYRGQQKVASIEVVTN
jgi:hypothetical protein